MMPSYIQGRAPPSAWRAPRLCTCTDHFFSQPRAANDPHICTSSIHTPTSSSPRARSNSRHRTTIRAPSSSESDRGGTPTKTKARHPASSSSEYLTHSAWVVLDLTCSSRRRLLMAGPTSDQTFPSGMSLPTGSISGVGWGPLAGSQSGMRPGEVAMVRRGTSSPGDADLRSLADDGFFVFLRHWRGRREAGQYTCREGCTAAKELRPTPEYSQPMVPAVGMDFAEPGSVGAEVVPIPTGLVSAVR